VLLVQGFFPKITSGTESTAFFFFVVRWGSSPPPPSQGKGSRPRPFFRRYDIFIVVVLFSQGLWLDFLVV